MAYYDDVEKRWKSGSRPGMEPLVPDIVPGAGVSSIELANRAQAGVAQRQLQEQRQQFGSTPARPLMPTSPGQAAVEAGKAVSNAALAIPTDLVDLGLGAVDVLRATAAPVTGDKFGWQNVFDDSDNPLTVARRRAFRMETEVGQAASSLLRIGTAFLAFPKALPKVASVAAKGARAVPLAAGLVDKAAQVARTAGRVSGLSQPYAPETVRSALQAVRSTELKTAAGKTLGKVAAGNDYLYATLRDFSRASRGAVRVGDAGKAEVLGGAIDRWSTVNTAVKQLTRGKVSAKTFAEFAAWDLFVSFNIAGEGDFAADETFSDMLASSNSKFLRAIGRPLSTTADEPNIQVKAKQMLEGLAIGGMVEGAMHMYRVSRYVNAFKKAAPSERAAILSAFEGEAKNIGLGLSKSMGEEGNLFTRAVPSGQAGAAVDEQARRSALKDLFLQGQGRETSRPAAAGPAPSPEPGGPLAVIQQFPAPSPAPGPVQDALRGMGSRGVLQAETPQALQPSNEELKAAFLASRGGQGGDEAAYAEWLQQNAPQIGGPIAPSAPSGQLVAPDIFPARVEELPARPAGSPLPAGRDQAGTTGSSAIQQAGIRPVSVSVAGEPIVTPQTYREGFARDALRAAREAWQNRELVYEAGAGGDMQRLFDDVKQLAPSSRLSAIELMKKIGVKLNGSGMQNAADSIMTNFIQERGLKEGWIRIDPEDFSLTIHPSVAGQLDKGDALAEQADSLDTILSEGQLIPGMQGVDLDPALIEDAMRSAAKADAADEAAQLEATRMAMAGPDQMTDDEVILRGLGSTPDRLLVPPVVEKLVDRPGFGVYGSDGEMIKSFTSQRGADAFAKQYGASQKEELVAKAREMVARENPVALAIRNGEPVMDSDIVGKVKITSSQSRALRSLFDLDASLPPGQRLIEGAWRPGMLTSIDELAAMTKGSRQVEMTQSQMNLISQALSSATTSRSLSASQKLAIGNMIQRLQESAQALEPQAIVQRDVTGLLNAMRTLAQHGEFCGVF